MSILAVSDTWPSCFAGSTYVFETVQVLVPLSAHFALERLLLLHAQRPRIGSAGLGVDNRKGAIAVFMQLLSGMAVGFVVPRTAVSKLGAAVLTGWR